MGDGTSKSAASRRFVALSAARMAGWMGSDLSRLDLVVIQIDGLHIGNDLVLVGALGIDGKGNKHPLGLGRAASARRRAQCRSGLPWAEALERHPCFDYRSRCQALPQG
jgi:hypothetical protein